MQNYSNHKRFAPKPYYFGILAGLVALIMTIFLVCCTCGTCMNIWISIGMGFLSMGLILIGYFARAFALKAQDRAIRAEEQFRHFLLTGKPLDPRLRMSQIIALRFSSDQEFPSLAQKAAEANLSSKDIKTAIVNWRADEYRV